MVKILNLVIQDRSDLKNPTEFTLSFEINENVTQPEKALRAAIAEFVNSDTEESIQALKYANGGFNWGDVSSCLPDNLFIKHGLRPVKQESIDLFVDHDEILCDRVPHKTEDC